MDRMENLERIAELEREIAALPPGAVSTKKVAGREYYYHRYTSDGKRIERYVDFDAVSELCAKIEKRRALEEELKELSRLTKPKKVQRERNTHRFRTSVRIGRQLENWALPARNFRCRDCYRELREYVFGAHSDRVFVLYGLRRTGKTTLLRQIVLDMTPEQIDRTAFLQIGSSDTLPAVNADLRYLEEQGYNTVFIDEVTLMEDFIEGAALFSDIYAASGMKIVLSGTDSLGFVFTESEQLYDRCFMLHTTLIPYREFESVLGIRGIDEFIRYGGTMSMGGVHYNEASSFATKKSADEYIDTAIARNIQHSLKYYRDGDHFRLLYELYRRGELTGAINRVIEDMNHRFTREVLTKTFTSDTLTVSARNLLRDRSASFDLAEHMDRDMVVASVRKMLEILEVEEQTTEVSDDHACQIREYLLLLDMIVEIDRRHLPKVNDRDKLIAISQPGLRYAQVRAHIDALLADNRFMELSAEERRRVTNRVMSTIQGRMMEDLVLLETKIASPEKNVFQLQFAVGEFDMVVQDPETLTCEIYEIKHSSEIAEQQYRHLTDPDKTGACEHRYGAITGRYVIYRGEYAKLEGVEYLNVEEYLKSLG